MVSSSEGTSLRILEGSAYCRSLNRGLQGLLDGFMSVAGLLSNQGEKSIDFYFIRVPLRKKVLKYGTPKPRLRGFCKGISICFLRVSAKTKFIRNKALPCGPEGPRQHMRFLFLVSPSGTEICFKKTFIHKGPCIHSPTTLYKSHFIFRTSHPHPDAYTRNLVLETLNRAASQNSKASNPKP